MLIPHAFALFHEAKVSIARIEKFLAAAEAPRTVIINHGSQPDETEKRSNRIEFSRLASVKLPKTPTPGSLPRGVTLHWPELRFGAAPVPRVLGPANLDLRAGSLTGVVGRVGEGKTALLLAILHELDDGTRRSMATGSTPHKAAVGYVAQAATILNATFRENICFGSEFDDERFAAAIDAACLAPDLAAMPAGDQTEIGENGVNLSGGQKARVSFARTLYNSWKCDLFVFDDPFAACDVHVAERMFRRGIIGWLAGATRVRPRPLFFSNVRCVMRNNFACLSSVLLPL